jgi:uncharacterized protein with FMN-binding domain
MSKGKKIALIVFVVVVLISAIGAYFIVQIQDNLDYLAEVPIEEIDITAVSDGSYIGEYEVIPISVIVEVEVLNHEIKSITILKHSNGQGEDGEAIILDVIDQQSILVDSIAGATYSSKVILLAIKDALS